MKILETVRDLYYVAVGSPTLPTQYVRLFRKASSGIEGSEYFSILLPLLPKIQEENSYDDYKGRGGDVRVFDSECIIMC